MRFLASQIRQTDDNGELSKITVATGKPTELPESLKCGLEGASLHIGLSVKQAMTLAMTIPESKK